MYKIKTKLAPVLNRRGMIVALTTAATLAPMASAQSVGQDTGISFSSFIQAVQAQAVVVINEAGPALFALMALIGGVFFVWNRVRSLW